jgi:hypothetical protein
VLVGSPAQAVADRDPLIRVGGESDHNPFAAFVVNVVKQRIELMFGISGIRREVPDRSIESQTCDFHSRVCCILINNLGFLFSLNAIERGRRGIMLCHHPRRTVDDPFEEGTRVLDGTDQVDEFLG